MTTKILSFSDTLKALNDKRILSIMILGFMSGFPWILHGSVLTLWLKDLEFSRSTIGFLGIVGTMYALNFTWAPLLDRLRIPFLYKLLDQRRSWIAVCLVFIAIGTFSLSQIDPKENIWLLGLAALLIAIASATQDVAIDAYRIDVMDEDEVEKMPYAAAAATGGWWAGYGFIGGALALFLGGEKIGLAWPDVYQVLTVLVILQIVLLFFLPKVHTDSNQELLSALEKEQLSLAEWFTNTFIKPFTEFFERCGKDIAIALLLFIFTFKLGEAFLGRMSLVFYKEVGFSTDQIGLYSKFIGGLSTAIFAFLGAMLNTRYGLIKGLFIGGVAMSATNLLFAAMSIIGPNEVLFVVTLILDNFTVALSTVAFIAFVSFFTSRSYTATQYALFVSIGNMGRTSVSSGSGYMVDALNGNWFIFFVITSLMVIPALMILLYLGKLLRQKQ